jgi:hypothetical protein
MGEFSLSYWTGNYLSFFLRHLFLSDARLRETAIRTGRRGRPSLHRVLSKAPRRAERVRASDHHTLPTNLQTVYGRMVVS